MRALQPQKPTPKTPARQLGKNGANSVGACAGTRLGPALSNGIAEHIYQLRHKGDTAWLRALQGQNPTPKTLWPARAAVETEARGQTRCT